MEHVNISNLMRTLHGYGGLVGELGGAGLWRRISEFHTNEDHRKRNKLSLYAAIDFKNPDITVDTKAKVALRNNYEDGFAAKFVETLHIALSVSFDVVKGKESQHLPADFPALLPDNLFTVFAASAGMPLNHCFKAEIAIMNTALQVKSLNSAIPPLQFTKVGNFESFVKSGGRAHVLPLQTRVMRSSSLGGGSMYVIIPILDTLH